MLFPMAAPSLAIHSVVDHRALPDDGPRCQLVEGELIMAPASNTFHQQTQRFVFAEDPAKPVALIDEPEAFVSPLLAGLTLATAEVFRR